MAALRRAKRGFKSPAATFRPSLEHLGERVLPAVTWQVQSDYFGTRDGVSQSRSLRAVVLSADDQHVYTGFIQGTSSAAIREVSAAVNASLIGNEPVPFGTNPPYTTGLEARVATTGFPRGLATDDRGSVYAVNTSNSNSFAQGWTIYSENLGIVANAVSSNATTSTLSGIATVNIGGTYYAYVGWRNGLIERWNVTDPTIPVLDTAWGAAATPGKVNLKTIDADAYLNNLMIDADGTIYVAGGLQSTTSFGDALIKIPAAGAAAGDLSGVTSVNVAGGADGLGGFAAMDVALFAGKAYVTEYLAANSTIAVFNTSDLSSDGILTPPVASLTGPSGRASTYNSDAGPDSGFSGIDISTDGRIFLAEQLYSFVPSSGSYTPPGGVAMTGTRIYFDRVLVSSALGVAPAITSAGNATFTVGTPGTFTITSTGIPTSTITRTGTLPAGVTFTDNGDGTATLAGTPAAGTGSIYPLTFTVSNGVAPDATQSFTLTVNEAPTITSANNATFTAGTLGTFTVTTGPAFPDSVTITRTGTLPTGVTFTDNGDGTATLAGTPASGTGGTYSLTFTASNGVAPDATQAFTLTVNEAPAITSGSPPGSLTVGTPASFGVTATGFPAPTYSLASGALPDGLTLNTANGVVSGTPTTVGRFDGVIRATNGFGTADQPFSITVSGGPVQSSVGQFAVSGGPAGANTVVPLNPDGSAFGSAFRPFGSTSARAVIADVTGDGIPDIVVGSGPGEVATVVVIDGATRATVATYQPFGATFTGGTFVAAGDVDLDGQADIAVTADVSGGPRVVVFNGATGDVMASFFGIDDPAFRGGARIALGDMNRDGIADLAVAAGPGGGPRVALYDGATIRSGMTPTRLIGDFYVYEPNLTDGVFLAIGDVDGDGAGDLATTPGFGGSPRVLILSGTQLLTSGASAALADPVANFFAGDPDSRVGARIAAKDLDGDDFIDLVVAIPGTGRTVRGYLGADLANGTATVLEDYSGDFDPLLTAVFVG